uniref:Uncharacterized protein n=1 Tax=Tanacetum cinerariifolium TaxID=118510 RepID=A0A6L2KYH2_TANCI|nr:hypothetical protein [Tanacetum cinerariifolium]
MELEKNKYKAKVALLKLQPSFPNVEQLKELLVKSLKTKFSNILFAHDFSSSLRTELKNLPSKHNELTGEVKGLKKQVHELEIELPGDLKEIPTKLDDFTKNITSLKSKVVELKTLQWELSSEFISLLAQVASVQAKLKTLDGFPSLLLNVTQALNKFTHVLNSASSKAGDESFFQRRAEKNAEKENLNNQQPKPTPPPDTTIIPSVITTTTTQMQSPSQYPQKGSSQPEGEHIKKDEGKKAMSLKDAEEMSTKSESNDETTHMPGSMVESSKKKELKKFDFVTESGEHVHLTKEQISAQNKIEEEAKVEAARCEGEIRKEELINLLGPEVDPITLKVYREDDTSKIIPEFKASDLHLGKWKEVVTAFPNKKRPLSEQDPLDRINDLANKKGKHADDIHDFFRANKRLKSLVQYKDHLAGTVLNEPVLGSSASALQVLRRLGSIFTSVYAAVQKLKKDSWKELQFSLVDNSKRCLSP